MKSLFLVAKGCGKGWTNFTLAKQQWKENTAIYPADIQTHLTPSTLILKKQVKLSCSG